MGQSSDCGPFGQEKPTSVYTKFQQQQPILLQQIMQWAVSDSVLLPLFLLLLWAPPPLFRTFWILCNVLLLIFFYLKPFWSEKWLFYFFFNFFLNFSNVFYVQVHYTINALLLFCNVLLLSLTWKFILISLSLSIYRIPRRSISRINFGLSTCFNKTQIQLCYFRIHILISCIHVFEKKSKFMIIKRK